VAGLRNAYKIVARRPKRNRNLGYTAFTGGGGWGVGGGGGIFTPVSRHSIEVAQKRFQRRPVLNIT